MRRASAAGQIGRGDQRALQQRGQQRGADPFSGDVRHHGRPAVRRRPASHRSNRRPPGATPRCCRTARNQPSPAGLRGQQALLDGARDVAAPLPSVRLTRSSSSRRAFSSTVDASMASVCSSSRLPPARSAATRRESMYSTPTVSLPVSDHAGRVVLARRGSAPAARRSRCAVPDRRRCSAARLVCAERIEVHRQQFAAMLQRAVDHCARNPQIGFVELAGRWRARATRVSSSSPVRAAAEIRARRR